MTGQQRVVDSYDLLRQQVAEAALDRHDDDLSLVRLVAINDAFPLIEAAVRAEAVAEERQRIIELVGDMCTYRERDGRALAHPHPADHLGPCPYGKVVQRILAAGSVPVATPAETGQCICDGAACYSAAENAARHPFVINQTCPVHGELRYHAAPKPAAEPSVGTGTPAEEVSGGGGDGCWEYRPEMVARPVSGGSGHAERQDDAEWRAGTREFHSPERIAELTRQAGSAKLAHMEARRLTSEREELWGDIRQLEYQRERLTAEVARLTAERLEFKRSVTTVVGMRETTRRERDAALAEVARCWAAIEAIQSLHRADPRDPLICQDCEFPCQELAFLAAALGDGE